MCKIANLGKIGKKKIIVSVIIVLILAAGGFFWWWQGRKIKGGPDDYVIKETTEGKIIENKRAGLIVKAPEGWEVKKTELAEGSIVIQTLNIEGETINGITIPPLTKGCGIEIAITYKVLNFEEIKKEVREVHRMLVPTSEEFEEVIINNRMALKNIWESKTRGSMIAIYIPTNKVYTFTIAWAPDEKEKCSQEFDKFLETISIK